MFDVLKFGVFLDCGLFGVVEYVFVFDVEEVVYDLDFGVGCVFVCESL